MKDGQRLKQCNTSAVKAHFIQYLSHPTSLSSSKHTTLLTCNNILNLNNDISTFRKSFESGIPEKQSYTLDKKEISYSSAENIEVNIDNNNNSKPIVTYGNVLQNATMRKNDNPVDVVSLRMLNMKLLKSMCTNSELNSKSMFSTGAETELLTFNSLFNCSYGSREGVERTPKFNVSQNFSQLSTADYSSTMMNVMNRALEITSACVDPMPSSHQLIQLPGKRAHCADD